MEQKKPQAKRITAVVTIKLGIDPLDAPNLVSELLTGQGAGMHVMHTILDKSHIDSGQYRGSSVTFVNE